MAVIKVTSYGLGHHDAPRTLRPPIDIDTRELRNPPDDPAVRARLTQLTGRDPEVAHYVMTTPGARELVDASVQRVLTAVAAGQDHIEVTVSCYGGRHRSVAIADEVAAELRERHHCVHIHHRHIQMPLLPSRRTEAQR
ncbi:hypothetical protein [Streptomyces sp. NPDC056399]|uniref:RapZ C-terminal domain-containing protein n=1 Tax=Streptomyces sp. NPDC056399 TaxID=3345807 RepID=UPI0035DB7A25